MKIKGKDIAIGVLSVVAGIFLFLLLFEKKKNAEKDEEIEELNQINRNLISNSLKNNSQISDELKLQIESLIDRYENIEDKVRDELISVLALIEIGEEVKAIRDLTLIIENLLREKYKDEDKFKEKKVIPLANYIEHAKEKKHLNPREYNTACILRDFRNEASHKMGVKDTRNMVMIGLLGGIELIFRLSKKISV